MEFEITIKYKAEFDNIKDAVEHADNFVEKNETFCSVRIEGDNQIVTWEEK
jgi:hypothetical protein